MLMPSKRATKFSIFWLKWETAICRFIVIVGLAFLFYGVAGLFAQVGQGGLPLNGQISNHQHTRYGDGGILQGLSPVGRFYINTNNAGNIAVSSVAAGGIFLWDPGTSSLWAGAFQTSQGVYSVNRGTSTICLGTENKCQAHYSGVLGYGNRMTGFRYNSYILGNYITNTANNAILIGNGDNLYGSINTSTNTIKFYNVATNPAMTITAGPSYTDTGNVGIGLSTPAYRLDVFGAVNSTGGYYLNGVLISTSTILDATKLPLTGGTLTGQLTINNASSFTITTGGASLGGNIKFLNTYTETISSNTVGTSTVNYNVAWSSSSIYNLTLTTSTVFTFSGASTGQTMTFVLSQDSVGSRLVTWPSTSTLDWGSYGTPTLSTSPYKTDFVPIYYNGAKYFGFPPVKGYQQ